MSIDIIKSRIFRYRQLTSRELFLDDSSDDARVKIRPEFKELQQIMMKNRLKLVFNVVNSGAKFGNNPVLDEIRTDIQEWCDSNCTGFWYQDFKIAMIEEEDPVSGRTIFKDKLEWKFILSFEFEGDLLKFMKEQALLTKLKF